MVFRYLFDHIDFELKQQVNIYFLGIARQKPPAPNAFAPSEDPDDQFMRRLQGHDPSVKKLSQATIAGDGSRVADKNTGERGVIFTVGYVVWLSDSEVEVSGGHFFAGLVGETSYYRVELKGNRWLVTFSRPGPVS